MAEFLEKVTNEDEHMPVCTLAPSEPGKGTSKSVLQYRMFSAQL